MKTFIFITGLVTGLLIGSFLGFAISGGLL